MVNAKTKLALVALAAGLTACGSTATAKAASSTASPATAPTVDCGAPNNPPKNMPPQPVADNCWAGGFYLGTGSFHNRKLIFADKEGISSLYAITPQLVRTNPNAAATLEQAATEFVTAVLVSKSANQYATSSALGEWMPSTIQQANAGDSLVTTTKVNPLGLLYNYPVILTGGVSVIPNGKLVQKFPVGSTAEVGECVDMQARVVDPSGKALNNVNGYTGWMKWADELTKTSTGWKISRVDIGLTEVKTPC